MKKLLRELELPQGCPSVDPRAVTRRVNAALNADPVERRLYMRRKLKLAAVLTAAVIALTGTALAVGPTLKEMIAELLGSFAPYAQEVGVSVTDQGLRVSVEAVVSDGEENTTAYVSVTDLTGDRLDGDSYLNQVWNSCISYDPDRRTALFAFKAWSAYFNEGTVMTLPIKVVVPGHVFLEKISFPQELLQTRTLFTQTLKDGDIEDSNLKDGAEAVVLRPNQTPATLGVTDLISISSAGFDADGVFHILYKTGVGVTVDSLPMFESLAFDDRERPDSYHTDRVWFNGGRYLDVAYPAYSDEFGNSSAALITQENVSHLTLDGLSVRLHTRPEIRGDWTLTFSVDALPKRILTINQALGGQMIKSVSITAVSADAVAEPIPGEKVRYEIPGLPLTLYFKDGTVIPVDDRYRWAFDRAVDPADVTGIAVGMWYMPLEGDAALPGHWLAELPK